MGTLDLALPSVNALNGRQNVDACRQPALYQFMRYAARFLCMAAGTENDDRIAHGDLFSLDLSFKQVYKEM